MALPAGRILAPRLSERGSPAWHSPVANRQSSIVTFGQGADAPRQLSESFSLLPPIFYSVNTPM